MQSSAFKKSGLSLFLQIVCCLSLLLFAGCGKVKLYSNLSEKEANEMIAILQNRGFDMDKQPGLEGTWDVRVDPSTFGESVEVLSALGYPKDQFTTVGAAFQKSGLVSSPSEERIRFMHALSQGIAETLTNIDGVLTARVHIVLQESDPLKDVTTPSSAAVFIKYRRGSGVEDSVAMIKNLVTNSIEGLSYDKVTIAFFPSDVSEYELDKYARKHEANDAGGSSFWVIAISLVVILALGGVGVGYWYFERQKQMDKDKEEANKVSNDDDLV